MVFFRIHSHYVRVIYSATLMALELVQYCTRSSAERERREKREERREKRLRDSDIDI